MTIVLVVANARRRFAIGGLLAILTSLLVPVAFAEKPPVFVILHMGNSAQAIQWGTSQGANGVEMDVQFTPDGSPYIYHGMP